MTNKKEERRRVALEQQIDENLRKTYEQDVAEEIPERFLELLEKLRKQG